ncbi:YmzC family protein [Bacillus thuringiensis]
MPFFLTKLSSYIKIFKFNPDTNEISLIKEFRAEEYYSDTAK